jgi:uncharacterized protein
MTGKLIFWIIVVVVTFLSLKFYIRYLEHKLVFIPDKTLEYKPSDINSSWEDVYLETDDGVKINGWFCPDKSSDFTILFFHGNAGNIKDRIWFLNSANKFGLSVFIIDYRGYGKSGGKPSEDCINIDATCAYNYLTAKRNIKEENIVLWGTSLGSAPATYLASSKKCKGLILFSAFTNASDMASIVMPFAPFVKYLLKIRYDNLARIKNIDIPVFIIHAENDNITPFWMGRKLFDSAREPKKFLSLSHSDHAIISEEDSDILWNSFLDFLKEDEKEQSSKN